MKTLIYTTPLTAVYAYNGAKVTVYNGEYLGNGVIIRHRYNRFAFVEYLGETFAVRGFFSSNLWVKVDNLMHFTELRKLYEIFESAREINRNAARNKARNK